MRGVSSCDEEKKQSSKLLCEDQEVEGLEGPGEGGEDQEWEDHRQGRQIQEGEN